MFGKLRAVTDDVVIERFPTRKTAALLAYLALNPGQDHSREALAELLWPDAEEQSQRHSLRLALSRLRALLGPDLPIEATRNWVRLRAEHVSTDVADFELAVQAGQLQEARQLFSGPLLPGLTDDWVTIAQARLDALLEDINQRPRNTHSTLPSGMRRMFGRQADLDQIEGLFAQNSVVTLTGMGGIGKTRLAAEFAGFQENSLWVSLVDVLRPEDIADAIRMVMGAPLPAAHMPIQSYVCRELADIAPLLLVLDNAEHLLSPELAEVITQTASVPGVKVLVTSRTTIPGLAQAEHPIKPMGDKAAAALFKDRVHIIRHAVQIQDASLATIVERHGGIPLAIELCAARIGIQSIREIEQGEFLPIDQLGESLGIPPRHQSLNEVLLASVTFLPPEEREALANLCVFRGGFTAKAAEAVAHANLATLESLRTCGLIVGTDTPDSVRFRIPEPIRDLNLEKHPATADRHALFMADWVEQNRADQLPEPPYEFGSRLRLQSAERFNVAAALETSAQSQEIEVRAAGLRIVGAYWTHWYTSNKSAEMEAWANRLLAGAGEQVGSRVQATARLALGLALRERGDHQGFSNEVTHAMTAFSSDEVHRDVAFAWHLRGFSFADFGLNAEADNAYQKAEELWARLDDSRNFSVTRHNRAMIALEMGNIDLAESFIWEALEVFNAHQSTYLGVGFSTLARVFISRDDHAGAADAYRNAILWNRKLGYIRGWAQNTRDLGLALHKLGNLAAAVELGTEALADFRRVGDRHGEATSLAALASITGEKRFASEARSLVARHHIDTSHELLRQFSTKA